MYSVCDQPPGRIDRPNPTVDHGPKLCHSWAERATALSWMHIFSSYPDCPPAPRSAAPPISEISSSYVQCSAAHHSSTCRDIQGS
jgi:hypothetical protein